MTDPVTIIGAGLGGLAAALALAARGVDVVVYEQAAALGEIGAGVHVSPNGLHVLEALGLGAAVDAVAARPRGMVTRHYASSEANFSADFDADFEQRYGAPFRSFHRADLHAALTSAATNSPQITIHLDHRLSGIVEHADHVALAFDNQPPATASCLVGADGVHSVVRAALHGEVATRFTGHVAYRGMVAAADIDVAPLDQRLNIWVGPGKHVVAYPVRRGELINYVAIVEESGWEDESWTTRVSVDHMKQAFADWHPFVRELLTSAIEGETYKWALLGRDPLPHWSTARITLLGDAAHPMVPYVAQGAVMAIEDAWVLGACLGGSQPVADALVRYQQARLPRTSDMQAAAWEQGQLNHAVGTERDNDFRGGRFASPEWIYGCNVVAEFPVG